MKEEKKNSTQHIYRVRMYRDFDFPSFSVDKSNTLGDLTYKAMEETKENYQNEGFFNFEVINILPFTLKTKTDEPNTGNMDYDFFIREVALENTKEQFGDINYETNPSVFDLISKTETAITFALKPEIEDYFLVQIRKYVELFGKLKLAR